MLKYVYGDLSATTMKFLAAKQAKVDALSGKEAQYTLAKKMFSGKTTKAFQEIKKILAQMAPAGNACYYCERDRYRDIDHIRPNRHYPQHCFNWRNYVYTCTICNQDKKGDKFAVLDVAGEIVEFDRQWSFDKPLPLGQQVLIDLRTEDPLDFLQLDLEQGIFTPIGDVIAQKRGKFTKDLFELNDANLARIRKAAYDSFQMYLMRYQTACAAQDKIKADAALAEIMTLPHPTVLVEMRRQAARIPALAKLFVNTPPEIGRRP